MQKQIGRLASAAFLGLALILGASGAPLRQAPSAAAAPAARYVDVVVGDNYFAPVTVYASPGDMVTWTNVGADYHTASSESFETGSISPGDWNGVTLWEPGTYYYYCALHADMEGWIVVE